MARIPHWWKKRSPLSAPLSTRCDVCEAVVTPLELVEARSVAGNNSLHICREHAVQYANSEATLEELRSCFVDGGSIRAKAYRKECERRPRTPLP